MGTPRSRLQYVVLVVLALALGGGVVRAARLDLKAGVGDALVDGTFTTVQARITDVGFPFMGSVLLTQHLGNAWQGTATTTLRIPVSAARAGRIEWTVPIYDSRQPMEATLFDRSGVALASCTVDLRSSRRDKPFPVQVGDFAMPVAEDAVAIGPDELPVLWQSYEGIRSLWLGRVPGGIASERWEALSRWVLAGGTLVVCTGRDFYLLETPLLDELLPVEHPFLNEDTPGASYLAGDRREGARVLLEQDGIPRLLERLYGAGRIVLVTESALDVSPAVWGEARRLVANARLVSLSDTTETLLDTMSFRRPAYLAAIALVALSALVPAVVVLGVGKPRRRLLFLAVGATVLCVASGLYSIRANHVVRIYECHTSLFIQASVGVTLFRTDLSTADGSPVRSEVRDAVPWMEETPTNMRRGRFDTEIDLAVGRIALSLGPGERRSLRSGGTCEPLLSLERTREDEVTVLNRQAPLHQGILFVSGQVYRVGEIPLGESRFPLSAAAAAETAFVEGGADPFLQSVLEELPLEHGLWLVGFRETEKTVRYTGLEKEVREAEAYVVMGDARA